MLEQARVPRRPRCCCCCMLLCLRICLFILEFHQCIPEMTKIKSHFDHVSQSISNMTKTPSTKHTKLKCTFWWVKKVPKIFRPILLLAEQCLHTKKEHFQSNFYPEMRLFWKIYFMNKELQHFKWCYPQFVLWHVKNVLSDKSSLVNWNWN